MSKRPHSDRWREMFSDGLKREFTKHGYQPDLFTDDLPQSEQPNKEGWCEEFNELAEEDLDDTSNACPDTYFRHKWSPAEAHEDIDGWRDNYFTPLDADP